MIIACKQKEYKAQKELVDPKVFMILVAQW
jgi:hypothetical protein